MNLIIDVGNTYAKLAIYGKNKLRRKQIVKVDELNKAVLSLLVDYPAVDKGIISSVGKLESNTVNKMRRQINLHTLSHKSKLPFKNAYKTPKTLGVDRIALVCASVRQFPDNNALIIDAGTCITYDFITANNVYLGGAISPGIRMRYEALNNLTANLPLLDTKPPRTIVGSSTETSIHSGVIYGIVNEIDGVIAEYKSRYKDLTVILTGGDSKFLSKRLKNSIFANSNFLLEGLNYILEFNSK